jgi:alpha-acetolactate decarboxylase
VRVYFGYVSQITMLCGLLGGTPAFAGESRPQAEKIVQYGKMSEAIGQKQHQGRVRFSKLTERPHFFGVAALEGLRGEATICDGELTVTIVDSRGRLHAGDVVSPEEQATMLVGAYVPSWTEHEVIKDVPAEAFDEYVESVAAKAGLNTDRPFVFTIEGEFMDVSLHVIHGACPIHARMKKIELPERLQPFEAELPKVNGKVVGIFAKDAVGNLTHPATSTHIHLLYFDPATGKTVTGHLERIGLQQGDVLRLPRN